jgi:hypothetical protein
VIVGEEGCSRYFIMGLLEVPKPDNLSKSLEALRQKLLSDPYFKGVPSMQPGQNKTALAFHAKDDLPEVRREVLALLKSQNGLRFYAVVKDKRHVVEYVRSRQANTPSYRYQSNELYDYLVRRLFNDKLHKANEYNIFFAQRGSSARTKALREALEVAQKRSAARGTVDTARLMKVKTTASAKLQCLQAVDYFLWSLQRLYEKREDRYLEYLWPAFKLIVDIDDKREKEYGMYYSQKRPLLVTSLP